MANDKELKPGKELKVFWPEHLSVQMKREQKKREKEKREQKKSEQALRGESASRKPRNDLKREAA
jgi:hypothetical protein